MGQAVFKRILFVCCYFGCKASRAGAGQDEKQACPQLLLHIRLTQGTTGDGDYGNGNDYKVNTRYSIHRHQIEACNFKQMFHLLLKRHMCYYSFYTYPDKDQRAEWLLKVWSQAPLSNSESSTISTCQMLLGLPKASTYHHGSTKKELNTSTQRARFCSSDCSKIPNIHTLYNPWPNL